MGLITLTKTVTYWHIDVTYLLRVNTLKKPISIMHNAHNMLDLIYNNKNISDHSSGFVLNHIETFLSQPVEIRNHHLNV